MVGALLLRDDHVLLAHRSPTKRWYPDVWDLVGGHVDEGETHRDALIREVHEELGVVVAPADLGDPVARVVDPVGPGGGLDITVWALRSWGGEPLNRAPKEHDDLRWFGRADALELSLAHRLLAPLIRQLLPPSSATGAVG